MKPLARRDGLVVRELPDELLVYDLECHKAHCLNATAALVFEHCDGRRSVEEIARILRRELDVPADERLVWLSLERLGRAHLLQERPAAPASVGRYSRRELVRRVGLAAALLPGVATVLAPTPAEAAVSGCIPAFKCTGAGTPPNPCYSTSPSLCGTCTCVSAGTCSPGC